MKYYTVEIVRTGYSFGQIEVLAESASDAEKLALDEAKSHLYSEKDADYHVDNVQESK